MLSLVVVMAAACSSDTATATADDTGTDEQSSQTTAAPEVETTTTTEPVVEEETLQDSDAIIEATIVTFTEAFGVGDADEAWSFNSVRCQGVFSGDTMEMPQNYRDGVAGYAAAFPGSTALNVSAVIDGDTAAVSYDTEFDTGESAGSYFSQPWILSEGQWLRDDC